MNLFLSYRNLAMALSYGTTEALECYKVFFSLNLEIDRKATKRPYLYRIHLEREIRFATNFNIKKALSAGPLKFL